MADYNSVVMTKLAASPRGLAQPDEIAGRVRFALGDYTFTNAESSTNTVALFQIPSGSRIITYGFGLTGAAVLAGGEIGLYAADTTTVVDADALVDSLVMAGKTEWGELTGQGAVDTPYRYAYEYAGLTADPQVLYTVALTLAGDSTGTGRFRFGMLYSVDG